MLKAPFPWFGGKSRAAALVWSRFGDVPNYVEPFAGSLAVLLARPHAPRIETVNDLDCYLANFWRAIAADPELVAHHADWPVNEADLHARHRWLVDQEGFREQMRSDPSFYDARIAGWWVWGICQWIGSGWCTAPEWTGRTNAGRRARRVLAAQRPNIESGGVLARGVTEKRPRLGRGGRGVSRQLPCLHGDSGAAGRGVHASAVDESQGGVIEWMLRLQDRLRQVRVCCGDWTRVLGPSPTTCIGITGVLLDPPYADTADRSPGLYAHDSFTVAHEVREWAIAHGDDPKLRIALCGYEGEHQMPDTWECVAWKAHGGYASNSKKRANQDRERIWFSPHCLRPQRSLFDTLEVV
jgi:site-specific DNA-adenine methylase